MLEIFVDLLCAAVILIVLVFAVFRLGWLYPRFGRWMAVRAMRRSPRLGRWLLPDERAEQIADREKP